MAVGKHGHYSMPTRFVAPNPGQLQERLTVQPTADAWDFVRLLFRPEGVPLLHEPSRRSAQVSA